MPTYNYSYHYRHRTSRSLTPSPPPRVISYEIIRPAITYTRTRHNILEYESGHDYCKRTDSTYARLYDELKRERESKESLRKMRADAFFSDERRNLDKLYDEQAARVRRAERAVEERRDRVLSR